MFDINKDQLQEITMILSEQFVMIEDDTPNEYIYENIQFDQKFPKANFTDNEMFIKFNKAFLRLIMKTLNESYPEFYNLKEFDIQSVDNEEFINVLYKVKIGREIHKCDGCEECEK